MRLQNLARTTAAVAVLLALFATAHAQTTTSGTDTGSQVAPFVQVSGTPGTPTQALAVDPHNSRNIYADGGGGRIARSFSGGEHWSVVQAAGIHEEFRAITVSPADPEVIAAFSTRERWRRIGRRLRQSRSRRALAEAALSARRSGR